MNLNKIRLTILKWVDMGYLLPKDLNRAVYLANLEPTRTDKKGFIDLLLICLGSLMLISGIIFFFAYNWKDINYYTKFAICQVLFILSLVIVIRSRLETVQGRVSITVLSLLTGVLLALIGQTYQTGADTYNLFLTWAIFILPLIIFTNFSILWLLEILLLNLSTVLYYRTFGSIFSFLLDIEVALTVMFLINLLILALLELIVRVNWLSRIVVLACSTLTTTLIFSTIVNKGYYTSMLLYIPWICALYIYYKRYKTDIFCLSTGILSLIITLSTLFIVTVDLSLDFFSLLLTGLVIISLSSLGGWWLKSLTKEIKTDE